MTADFIGFVQEWIVVCKLTQLYENYFWAPDKDKAAVGRLWCFRAEEKHHTVDTKCKYRSNENVWLQKYQFYKPSLTRVLSLWNHHRGAWQEAPKVACPSIVPWGRISTPRAIPFLVLSQPPPKAALQLPTVSFQMTGPLLVENLSLKSNTSHPSYKLSQTFLIFCALDITNVIPIVRWINSLYEMLRACIHSQSSLN